jgi:hypothetical protein
MQMAKQACRRDGFYKPHAAVRRDSDGGCFGRERRCGRDKTISIRHSAPANGSHFFTDPFDTGAKIVDIYGYNEQPGKRNRFWCYQSRNKHTANDGLYKHPVCVVTHSRHLHFGRFPNVVPIEIFPLPQTQPSELARGRLNRLY